MMSSRGELRNELSAFLTKVMNQGHKIEDVIPEEMQDHFHEMTELKTARQYIKEVEDREKALQAENNNLLTKVKAQEEEIANQPADFKSLKIDLQLAQRQIEFQRKLADDAAERATRYQRKLTEISEKQTIADNTALKIERLRNDFHNQQAACGKLVEENAEAAKLAEKQHIHDQELIREKDKELAAIMSAAKAVEYESEQFSDTFTTLIESLESEQSSAAAAVNRQSILLHRIDKNYSAIVSEITPLNRVFDRIYSILGIYQLVFQMLSDPSSNAIANLPPSLDVLMDGAADDLYIYQNVHQSLQTGGVAEKQVRVQLDGIAKNAGNMYNSLDSIKDDVAGFLQRLRSEPDAWMAMKGKYGIIGKLKRLSLA